MLSSTRLSPVSYSTRVSSGGSCTWSLLSASVSLTLALSSSPTDWLHPGFLFTTPANVNEVVISIRNNGPGGDGNDIAIDDITFTPCGPVIIPAIDGIEISNKDLCIGDTKDIITVGDKWATFEAENFNQTTQPLYGILDTNEKLMNHPVGYTPNAAEYLKWLQCGKAAFDKGQ